MAIKWDKLTVKSQEAIQGAASHAAENGNPEVLPLHLMAALLEDKEGVVIPVLEKVGVGVQQLLAAVNSAIAKLPKVQGASQQPGMGAALTKVLDQAFKEAENFKDDYVSTEHLLLALAKQKGEPVQTALAAQGATYDAILKALAEVRGAQRVTDQNPEGKFQALEKYAKDLTELARKGKLDPVIGRDEEIRRVIQVLSRRTKNNPVLIGEPGVGKTAIVEGSGSDARRSEVPRRV
jgi:ATP-dependent Clp protease ATP-binding subunit ClpB